jgi:hypothetical protein
MGININMYIKFNYYVNRMDEILLEFIIKNDSYLIYFNFYTY